MNHIYCFSGLGADQRIFQKLHLQNAEVHFIGWETPLENDTMRSYALKLARQIKHDCIYLAGVSFGGMLASEISCYYQQLNSGKIKPEPGSNLQLVIKKTILISSCKSENEFPWFLTLAGRIKIHRIAPYHFLLRNNILNRLVFDRRSKKEELYLKRLMLRENSTLLIKRSINIILTWRSGLPENIVHIHGSGDRLLTPAKVKADFWIKDAGHFMVYNRAAEISNILNNLLSGNSS